MSKLFQTAVMTETEIEIVKEAMSNPAVGKYLRILATNAAADMALSNDRVMGKEVEDPHTYQVKNAFIQGTIATLADLVDLAV